MLFIIDRFMNIRGFKHKFHQQFRWLSMYITCVKAVNCVVGLITATSWFWPHINRGFNHRV